VLQQEQTADRKLIENLKKKMREEAILLILLLLLVGVISWRYVVLLDTITSSNVQTLQAGMCVR
jgi:hypothetical protein